MLDKDIVRFSLKPKRTGRPVKLIGSQIIEKELLSPKCLNDWAHLSIVQRCQKIQNKYGVLIKRHKLQLFYQRHNIRCKPTHTKYYPHGQNQDLLQARRYEFAMRLTEYIFEQQHPIIYLDQTSFRSDMVQKKIWFYSKHRFVVPAAKVQGAAFTVYGAVGECIQDKCFYYEIHDSTNMDDFKQFIQNLAAHLVPQLGGVKPVLVLDNHSAHRGADRRELMEQFFKVEYTPVYSCELNGPIESVWSVLKRKCLSKFTKLMLRKRCSRETCI